MYKLMDILRGNKSLKGVVRERLMMDVICGRWRDIVGRLFEDLRPVYVKGRVLCVESSNPMWVSEVDFFKDEIIKKVNDIFGKKVVCKIVVKRAEKEVKVNALEEGRGKQLKKRGLEDFILEENRQKRQAGKVLCPECREVYVSRGVCFFCKTEGS